MLVAGAPRSGTTLLSALLSTSPDCQPFRPEAHYLAEVVRAWASGRADFEVSTQYFCRDRAAFDDLHFDFVGRLLDEARATCGSPRLLVVKHCTLTPLLPALLRRLPRLRAVVIARDCAALAVSMRRAFGESALAPPAVDRLVRTYNAYYGAAVSAALADPDRCLLLRYESLVSGAGPDIAGALGIAPLRPDRLWDRADFDLPVLVRGDPLSSSLWGEPLTARRLEEDAGTLGPALAERIGRDTREVARAVERLSQAACALGKELEPC